MRFRRIVATPADGSAGSPPNQALEKSTLLLMGKSSGRRLEVWPKMALRPLSTSLRATWSGKRFNSGGESPPGVADRAVGAKAPSADQESPSELQPESSSTI